jgi:hypothetical protein
MIHGFSSSITQSVRVVNNYEKRERIKEPAEVGSREKSLMLKSAKDFYISHIEKISHKIVCVPGSNDLVGLI